MERKKYRRGTIVKGTALIGLSALLGNLLAFGDTWSKDFWSWRTKNENSSNSTSSLTSNAVPLSTTSLDGPPVLIQATNLAWNYFDGYWFSVNVPGWGQEMRGGIESEPGAYHYGRQAEISTNSPFAELNQRAIGGAVTVLLDGKVAVEKTIPNNGVDIKIPIYKNLSGWHSIRVVYSLHSEIDGLYISNSASVKQPKVPSKKLVVVGHSYVEGSDASNIGKDSFTALLGQMLGVQAVNQGIGGTDVDVSYPLGAHNSGLDRWKLDVVDEHPSAVLVVYGLNATGYIVSGKISNAKYQTDFTTFLADIRTVLPNTPIFVSGISATPHWSDAALGPFNTDIQNATNAVSNCHFIDLSGLWNNSNFNVYISSQDQTHPTDAGHKFLAKQYANAISPYLS